MPTSLNQMRWNYLSATKSIEVGTDYYFCNRSIGLNLKLKVISKSFHVNHEGWPSSIYVEVVQQIMTADAHQRAVYAVGTKHIVDALSLHKTPQVNPVKPFRRWY
jgi:hypothetical protein